MNNKLQTMQKLYEKKVVAVVRGETADQAEMVAKGAHSGGIQLMEITYTVPGASGLIEKLQREDRDWIIGAGTVLDDVTARLAILAGARFIVSPSFNKDTALLCNRYQIPYIPGCFSVKEVVGAMEAGAEVIKIFPGNVSGPDGLKAINGPLPQANLMPSGGVSEENVQDWLQKGAAAVSIGSSLYKNTEAEVAAAAKSFVQKAGY
ncbi:2-dehydro-3-deoxyphosphogluconate aldolase/(4S)-4-hydroxy-2-oxoglutarate aldolase [Sinobaca qinghaiensis]|uniref:2-dehydro-3-deoxyphosphogluconate aldolase/(4S)-4-hydroxy-2-oxoglutarate aldolase n=1 Tax=Sinobaca qinghaiensis TaxID=342944 RepID=A0A419V8B8_9BACL|nr:bifunctional 2-keto-4-hydroxyglutarate aldolase/2-keto-3-deoxy-6-phosphogluconate aldolase [Sinobaca qinghaiensis]RKD76331.1 2-dehydro-3-deoxyphosphogluconate aldolase/(4S)-4-hydroxy-2-oxoglutarate aldolase [Sinobaca qinghaiensis]